MYKGRKKKTIEYFAIKSVDKLQKSKVLQEVSQRFSIFSEPICVIFVDPWKCKLMLGLVIWLEWIFILFYLFGSQFELLILEFILTFIWIKYSITFNLMPNKYVNWAALLFRKYFCNTMSSYNGIRPCLEFIFTSEDDVQLFKVLRFWRKSDSFTQ